MMRCSETVHMMSNHIKNKLLLVVDIGNTEVVLGVYRDVKLEATWRLSSQAPRTSDECWILFKNWCIDAGIDFAAISGTVISSVVPSLTDVYQSMVSAHLAPEPVLVSAETDIGLKIRYQIPQQVGADRLCNSLAAIALYGAPAIVVDLGTATTFDVVTENCEYLGGAISLGLMGASNELHRLAAKLPRVDLKFPARVVGTTTEESMQSGIMWGTVSLIDGMVEKIAAEMHWAKMHVIGTGGASKLIAKYSRTIEQYNPFLTLEGMRLIYHRLQKHS
jgi:type III pantothenate kinase